MSNKWLVSVLFLLLCYTIFVLLSSEYVDTLCILHVTQKRFVVQWWLLLWLLLLLWDKSTSLNSNKQCCVQRGRELASFRAISMWQESSYYVHSYWPFKKKNLSLMSIFSLSFNQLVIQSDSQKINSKDFGFGHRASFLFFNKDNNKLLKYGQVKLKNWGWWWWRPSYTLTQTVKTYRGVDKYTFVIWVYANACNTNNICIGLVTQLVHRRD